MDLLDNGRIGRLTEIMEKVQVAIIGLGYVGLPLARSVVTAGMQVLGIDLSEDVFAGLSAGRSHVDDVSDAEVGDMLQMGLQISMDFDRLGEADVIVICVPTPLTGSGAPDLSAIESAAQSVAENLRDGQLVILESTTYPGTTEEVVVPILRTSGLDIGGAINVAFSPERVDPGNVEFNIGNTPKVVGGLTSLCTERAAAFYANFVHSVVRAKGLKEAEMTKLLENTYRQVNIALMNEMARFCHLLEIDLWDAIRCAATKPFGFESFYPGPGVGGHCIPIDPNYLSHRFKTYVGQPFRFVELAQEINGSMPDYVARRIQDALNSEGKPLWGSRVMLVGVTYKANVSDQREAPAFYLGARLLSYGVKLSFVDPYVEKWSIAGIEIEKSHDLAKAASEVDVVVILQHHRRLEILELTSIDTRVIDTRGVLHGENIEKL